MNALLEHIKWEEKVLSGKAKEYRTWFLVNGHPFESPDLEKSKALAKKVGAEMKHCYHNCFRACYDSDLKYFEGYVCSKAIPIPLEHSWMVDLNGKVVDPTLIRTIEKTNEKFEDYIYYGVAIDNEEVLKKCVKAKQSGPFLLEKFLEETK